MSTKVIIKPCKKLSNGPSEIQDAAGPKIILALATERISPLVVSSITKQAPFLRL